MNQEFFIHGKPNNLDIFGASDSKTSISGLIYEETFTRFSRETRNYPYMQAELRSLSGAVYSVYTYQVPTVVDTSVRKSYFSMTLVTQGAYCTRLSELFLFFEQTYRLVTGQLGVIDAGTGKYRVNLFREAKGLAELPPAALEQIRKKPEIMFVAMRKDGGFLKPKADVEVALDDCDSRAVSDVLAKQGGVMVSRHVASNGQAGESLKKAQAEISRLRQQVEQLTESSKSLAQAKKRMDELSADLSSAKNRVTQLERENQSLNDEQKKSEKELQFVVGQLQEPLGKLMARLGEARESAKQSEKLWLRFMRFVPFINLILLLLLGFLCYKWTGNVKKNYPDEPTLEFVETMPRTVVLGADSVTYYKHDVLDSMRQACEGLQGELEYTKNKCSMAEEEVTRLQNAARRPAAAPKATVPGQAKAEGTDPKKEENKTDNNTKKQEK